MIVIFQTSKKHHIAMSKIQHSECGKKLIAMDVVHVEPGDMDEEKFRSLNKVKPFCKTCVNSRAWRKTNWRL